MCRMTYWLRTLGELQIIRRKKLDLNFVYTLWFLYTIVSKKPTTIYLHFTLPKNRPITLRKRAIVPKVKPLPSVLSQLMFKKKMIQWFKRKFLWIIHLEHKWNNEKFNGQLVIAPNYKAHEELGVIVDVNHSSKLQKKCFKKFKIISFFHAWKLGDFKVDNRHGCPLTDLF